jgi:hypothetical protein
MFRKAITREIGDSVDVIALRGKQFWALPQRAGET